MNIIDIIHLAGTSVILVAAFVAVIWFFAAMFFNMRDLKEDVSGLKKDVAGIKTDIARIFHILERLVPPESLGETAERPPETRD